MDYNEMSSSQSMEVITSMINKARNRYTENGTLYLFWGWIVLFCCLVQFIALQFYHYNAYQVWFVTWIFAVAQIFFIKQKRKKSQVRTYTEELNGSVWLVFAIGLFLSIFLTITSKNTIMLNSLILVNYGMPIFLSGRILKFRPLIYGGICCWILSVIAVFIPFNFQLLLLATGIIAGWIIPGFLLRIKYKNQFQNG